MTDQGNGPDREWQLPTGVAGETAAGGSTTAPDPESLYGGPEPVRSEGVSAAPGGPAATRAVPDSDKPESGKSAGASATEAKDVAVSKAAEVKDAAVSKAADVKDEALQRGSDVAAVAKDELGNVAVEFRDQAQRLWSDASGQLQEQARSGQQQLSELLHSLASELGHLASRSEQDGPLTALARNASAQGGEWSHWLATTEPSDVLAEVRRFARRRPVLFLTGAAVAGVLVGRLSRGLMANSKSGAPQPASEHPAASPTPAGPVGPGYDHPAGGAIGDGPVRASEDLDDITGQPLTGRGPA